MIDVLLVLLVIFMAALPLSQRGLDASLPSESAPVAAQSKPDDIVVEYTADRKLAINKQDVSLDALEPRLREIYESRRDKTLFIMGAGTLRYGDNAEALNLEIWRCGDLEKIWRLQDLEICGFGDLQIFSKSPDLQISKFTPLPVYSQQQPPEFTPLRVYFTATATGSSHGSPVRPK